MRETSNELSTILRGIRRAKPTEYLHDTRIRRRHVHHRIHHRTERGAPCHSNSFTCGNRSREELRRRCTKLMTERLRALCRIPLDHPRRLQPVRVLETTLESRYDIRAASVTVICT